MPSTYVHLTGKDLDEALLRVNTPIPTEQPAFVESQTPELTEDAVKSLLQNEKVKRLLLERLLASTSGS